LDYRKSGPSSGILIGHSSGGSLWKEYPLEETENEVIARKRGGFISKKKMAK